MPVELLTSEVKQEYGASTELSLTAEVTRSVGDALIGEAWLESTTISPSIPTGWTLLTSIGVTSYKVWVFGRIADGTSTDNFKSTFTSVGRLGGMRRIVGGPAAVASWVIGTATKGSSKVAKPAAITTMTPNTLCIDFWETFSASTVEKTTAGWTASSGNLIATLSKLFSGKESSGEPEVTYTATQSWMSVLIGIPPKEEEAKASPALSMVI